MSIKSYFPPAKNLEHTCNLEKVVSASTARAVRSEIKEAATRKRLGSSYDKIPPEKKAKIAKFAAENGIAAAIRSFKKEGLTLKESTVRGWKKDHCANIAQLGSARAGISDARGTKRAIGRPLLLGNDVEDKAKQIIRSIRDAGGVINNSIVIGIIKGIVKDTDSNLLAENGGSIEIGKPIARRLLERFNYVKRRGSTTAKITVNDFSELREQFLADIKTVVQFENIPSGLILNWDHTGLNYVPTSSWTLETKGATKVPIAAIDDKRQITAVFTCTLRGDFLPPQVIYGGKTPACLPKAVAFPPNWQVTYTPNHWANESTMLDYANTILLPYLQQARQEYRLPSSHPALVIFDQFKGQLTNTFLGLLECNNILVVRVPANCTNRLQPLDLSVNKAIKDCLKSKFQGWYAEQITQQLKEKPTEVRPADLRLSVMKPLGAKWLIDAVSEIKVRRELIVNGFHNAGISEAVKDAHVTF